LGDLLDFSRLEAGQIEIEETPFDLAELLDEVVAGHAKAAEGKALALELRADAACGAQVIGDRRRVKQVLDNLLDNAVKFTDRGFVELSVGMDEAPGGYRFEVRDTGVGFEPRAAERLFAGFEQADGSLTRAHGGAGLGLAICDQIVRQHAGTIHAESEPGLGTTFTIRLPLDCRDKAEAPAVAAVASEAKAVTSDK
jgi:signal transduction histidine kinase